MLWESIYQQISKELAAGRYAQGQKLPTESEFASRFGVNRHTVRRALKKLADESLVFSRRGSGVFVKGRPLSYRLDSRTKFSTHLDHTAKKTGLRILHRITRPATLVESKRLDIKKSELIHHIEGIRTRNDIPIMHFTSLFPAALAPPLLELLYDVPGISEALKKCGIIEYTRKSSQITVSKASALTARHLMIKPGDVILQVESINCLPDGKILEAGNTVMAADLITLDVVIK